MRNGRMNVAAAFAISLVMIAAAASDAVAFTINSNNYIALSKYPGIKSFDYSTAPVRENFANDCMVDPEYAFRMYSTEIDEYFGTMSNYVYQDRTYKGVLLKNNTKGKCGVRYNKLFRYEDDWIDVRTTYVDWKANDSSKAFVYGGFCKAHWTNISYVRMKHEFFKSGTNEPVVVKGFLTYNDIDNHQGIGLIPSQITKIWRNKNGTDLKYQVTEEGYHFIKDPTGVDVPSASSNGYDPATAARAIFSYQFKGKVHEQLLLDGQPDTSFNYMGFQNKKEIPSAIPSKDSDMIKKEVSVAEGEYGMKNSVRSWNGEWQYRVAAFVPMETESGNLLDAFSITDQIDECLEISKVKILRGAGTDVTSQFDIKINDNKIVAASSVTGDKNAYGYTYYMLIDVRTSADKEDMQRHGHFKDEYTAVFRNKADISYTDGKGAKNIETNETESEVVFPFQADVTVTKRIRKDEIYLDHGVPSFVIRLAGTELSGREEVEYNRVVTFSPEYIEEHGSSEYIDKTVVFEGVKEGTYICEEYSNVRYKLDKIADISGGTAENGSTGKPHVIFKIDDDKARHATFVNIRKGWGQYSDSKCVVNKIGE